MKSTLGKLLNSLRDAGETSASIFLSFFLSFLHSQDTRLFLDSRRDTQTGRQTDRQTVDTRFPSHSLSLTLSSSSSAAPLITLNDKRRRMLMLLLLLLLCCCCCLIVLLVCRCVCVRVCFGGVFACTVKCLDSLVCVFIYTFLSCILYLLRIFHFSYSYFRAVAILNACCMPHAASMHAHSHNYICYNIYIHYIL